MASSPKTLRLPRSLHSWWSDEHVREVARGASLAFWLKVVGAGLNFAFNIAIARLLGADGAGLYFLALSVAAIASIFGRVGLDNTLLRYTATHVAKRDWLKVKGVHSLGLRIAAVASGTLSLIGFWLGPWMAGAIFDKPDLAEPLRWMSLSILPFALVNLQAESLKGLKLIRSAMLVQGIGVPLLALSLVWPLAWAAGVNGAVWAYLTSTVIVAILGTWAWQRALAEHKDGVFAYPFGELWASCKSLWVSSLMRRALLPWMPLFLLGIWASTEDIGVFGAANRVALLVSFTLVAVNNVLAPKFAELYAHGELVALARTARRAALMITAVASPIFLLLLFEPSWVLSLFGPGFERGALVLRILAAGQLINALTGSVNQFLIVTGNETTLRNTVIIAAGAQFVISLLLIPWMHSVGAAIAVALATAGLNMVSAYIVWKKMGVVIVPFVRRAG